VKQLAPKRESGEERATLLETALLECRQENAVMIDERDRLVNELRECESSIGSMEDEIRRRKVREEGLRLRVIQKDTQLEKEKNLVGKLQVDLNFLKEKEGLSVEGKIKRAGLEKLINLQEEHIKDERKHHENLQNEIERLNALVNDQKTFIEVLERQLEPAEYARSIRLCKDCEEAYEYDPLAREILDAYYDDLYDSSDDY
jgi:chromosome segregation ATPase